MTTIALMGFGTLLAAGMAACVYLFAAGKQDLRRAERRWARCLEEAQQRVAVIEAELAKTREQLHEIEESSGLLVAPQPPISGLNLGKRSHAIRLARRGEKPPQIAAALRVPVREIELLLKVHRIVLSAPLGDTKIPAA